jgi:GMP synthase (glutamine-hydrolysing)
LDCVILKLGSAPAELVKRRGDFEQWFAHGLGLPVDCRVVNPVRGDALPEPHACRGVVLTGSDAMLTDNPDWSLRAQAWLERVLAQDVPVLGVCYGHQLLAQTLGGKVGWSPAGEEIGTVTVELTRDGRSDPLFAGLPPALTVQAAHSQGVLELPPEARLLAANTHERVQAFAWGTRAWGLQFHPEFDADVSRFYIEDDREKFAAEKRDPDALLRATRDSEHGIALLRRFASLLK